MSRRLALIIGNSRYDDSGLASLAAPDVDVRELGEALRSANLGQFDEVIQLVDETSPTVRRAIAQLFHLKRREDLLLLYFSGHGIRDDQGQLYLATRDTERNLLSATAVEASFITGQMDRSASRRQVLILDCCHSGAFGAKNALGASIGTASAFQGIGFGRVVLTATDATQYAWEGERVVGSAEPSLFTNFLVLGIQSGAADLNGDGEITVDELYEYTYDEIVNSTSKQVPGKWAFKQQGEIVIARNPRGAQPEPLPQALILKVASQVESLQLEAIRDLAIMLRGQHRGRSIAARKALEKLETADLPRVAEAAHATLAMYPTPLGGAPGSRQDFETARSGEERRVEAAAGWNDVRLGHVLKLSASVLAATVLILSGALGVWKVVVGPGNVPSISQPPRLDPPTAPTSGMGAPAVANGTGGPAGTGSKVPEGSAGRAGQTIDATDGSRTASRTARVPVSPTAGNTSRTPGRVSQSPAGKRRSSSEDRPTNSPVTPPPTDTIAPAPKETESAPDAAGARGGREESTAVDDRNIRDLLDRYRQAYNRKDLHAIKQIFPTVDENLFGRGQRDCAAFDVRFVRDPEVHFTSADKAIVNTMSTYRCIPRSRAVPGPTDPQPDIFMFARTPGGWVIERHMVPRG
jgi:hypothetical protein